MDGQMSAWGWAMMIVFHAVGSAARGGDLGALQLRHSEPARSATCSRGATRRSLRPRGYHHRRVPGAPRHAAGMRALNAEGPRL